MSVWTSDSQAVSLARSIYGLGPQLSGAILPEKPSDYLGCHPKIVRSDARDDWEALADIGHWPVDPPPIEGAEDVYAFFSNRRRCLLGISAVYEIVYLTARGKLQYKPTIDRGFSYETAKTFIHLVEPSTQISPGRFIARYMQMDSEINALGNKYLDAAESFKAIRIGYQHGKREATEPRVSGVVGDYRLIFIGDLLLALGREAYSQRCLVLGRIHLDYLIGALTRIGNSYRYFSRAYKGPELSVAHEVLLHTIHSARQAKKVNANKVAKAFHKARALFQMECMASVLDDAVITEGEDYGADGLESILPYAKYRSMLLQVPVVRALELCHIYKWMPPPDFDATTAPTIVEGYHRNHRTGGPDWGSTTAQKDLYSRIVVERKVNLATAFKARHNQWPAGLTVRGKYATPTDVADWDPTGVEVYNQMGTDIVSQIKDKVVVASTLERELHGRRNPSERSYLLWYLANAGRVNTIASLREYNQIPEEEFVRSAYKPEAQKPDSRLFYIATPIKRTLLGELESNLSNFARHYPGSLMGRDTADKARICAEIMDLHTPCAGIPIEADYTTFVVTFDLSKFSPKSSPGVTAEYHDFWSRVYGTPAISDLYNVGCKAKITHNTAGIEYTYQNPGCDLEGFRGRMMTMFHADMLSAAVRLAREKGLILGRSKLGVFIDDGALKVAVAGTGQIAKDNAVAFLEVMKDVYAAAGQDNHPSKTVVSRTGGEILATIYYRGLAVPQGIKAIMKLAPDYENAASTFPEEMDSLFATAQGAVKAGANWVVAYGMLVEATLDALQRWDKTISKTCDHKKLAIYMMAPKSFGGFGVTSLQGLVTNAAVNATVEGLGMLNRVCRSYPDTMTLVKPIVTAPVVQRPPLAVLRDPLRVRTVAPVMIENRLTMAVVQWLEENAGEYAAFMAAYKSVSLVDHASQVATALLSTGVVSVPILRRAWDATPLHFVEGVVSKFKRSATVISLLGHRKLGQLRKKNMGDVRAVLANCM